MKNFKDYFDQNGLLCQKGPQFDGGDTVSHEGLAWLAAWYKGVSFPSPTDFKQFLSKVVLPNGLLIRNPINYSNPLDTSRDQYRAVAIACVFYGQFNILKAMYEALPRNRLNWPYYPNGDVFSPQDYAIFNPTASWLIRLISDLLGLLGVLVLCFWETRSPGPISRLLGRLWWPFIAMNPPNAEGVQGSLRGLNYTSDDLDAIMTMALGKEFNGTFLARLSRFIYAKFRPGGAQLALDSYFGSEDSPPVNELFRTVLPELLNGK